MSAWGKGGTASSCNSLLTRIEKNDATFTSVTILPSKTFGDAEALRLSRGIGGNAHLVSLSASGHHLSPAALLALGRSIAKSTCAVKELAVGDATTGEGVRALCEGLGVGGGGLEKIDLGYKGLTAPILRTIGETFSPSKTLTHLTLSRNNITDDGVRHLLEASSLSSQQPCFPSLTHLHLAHCDISATGLKSLVTLLLPNKSRPLLHLDLEGNNLHNTPDDDDNNSMKHLPELCHHLSLRNCQIQNNDLTSLLSSIAGHDNLLSLNLTRNRVTFRDEESPTSLPNLLPRFTKLTELQMAENPCGGAGVATICRSLPPQLHRLDLSRTDCGCEGAIAALRCGSGVTHLRLFDNSLRSAFGDIVRCLLNGTSDGENGGRFLEELDLGGNRGGKEHVQALLRGLCDDENLLKELRVLEMGGNELAGDECDRLLEELKACREGLDVARDRPVVRGG